MDLNTKLSRYFYLHDLIPTDTGLSNIPSTQSEISNLTKLANTLDTLRDRIGNFSIISAFRSDAVNQAVGGVGTSYHRQGMAADIVPLSMSAKDYWGKVIADPGIRNSLGEIALKNTALHISLPSSTKVGVPMIVNEAGEYIKKSLDEALAFIGKNKVASISFGIIAILAIMGGAYYYSRKRSTNESTKI